MPIAQKSLLSQLDNAILGGASVKGAIRPVNSNLVNSVMCSTYSNVVNTTSGSGVVNIPIVQPANTVIEDIIPICTAGASHDAASVGFKVGTTEGSAEVVAAVVNAISAASAETTAAGQGSSIHLKVATSMGGPANTVIEDIIPICTVGASHDDGDVGFKVGLSEGTDDVVSAVVNAIQNDSTSTAAGQGTSIHQKITTSMGGGAPLIITQQAGYTSTERTIYAQVSGSTGGFTNSDGAFRVIIKYYNL